MPDDRSTESAEDLVYLVDGSGYIFRAFHALPPMSRPDGTPTNAVHGFVNMMTRALEEWPASHLAVVFDASSVSFRNGIYSEYKAHRPDPPEELVPQFGLIREATRAFGLPCIEMENYEADDLIATFARRAVEQGRKVVIVSSDKDLMQLVSDRVSMFDPMKNRGIGPAEVREKFGVGPDRVIDVQSLAGDSVDNVPGVPGIGVKTAARLIDEYGDLDSLLERAGEIKQPKRRENLIAHAEMARISRTLVTLKDDVAVEDSIDSFKLREPDPEPLFAFLTENAMRATLARLRGKFGGGPNSGGPNSGGPNSGGPAAVDPAAAELAPGKEEFELVQDEAALRAWIDRIHRAGAVAIDTETTSLDAMRAELVGISLSVRAGEACYIPLGHTSPGGGLALEGDRPKQIPLGRALEMLRPTLTDPSILKVGQNIKYDWLVLAKPPYGIEMAPVDDTMVMSYVLDAGQHGHGMDELAELHLGKRTIKYRDVVGTGKSQIGFAEVALDRALDYAAEDADVTGRLHRLLRRRLVRDRKVTVYETLDRPLIPVLGAMERHGIKVDREELSRMSRDFARRIASLEAGIHEQAGEPFNIGSPKQLGEILFAKLGLRGGGKTKTGGHSTSSDVLEPLARDNPVVADVLSWRQLSKLKSTYADALGQHINPATGRVHTSYSQTIAVTGRLSSNDPNLQNIPIRTEEGRGIRRAFVAEPGHVLLSVDYSQIELRVVAHMAGISALKEAFANGEDIHARTASMVFGVPMEEMDGETRRKAKAINFGIIYGISGFGLANNLNIPTGEAKAFIDRYLDRFHELRTWLDETKAGCRKTGYVETLFGRRVHVRGINDRNPNMRGFAERQAINAPIQGAAADIIKRAMVRVPPALEQAGLKARMLLQVHDELLFETPEDELDGTAAVVREVMETATMPALRLSVPLVADAGHGRTWAEAH